MGNFAKLRTLTTQLPAGARIFAGVAPAASWTVDTYMLAAIVDNLSFLRYEQAGGKGRKPKQVPRPAKQAKAKHKRLGVSEQRRQELLFGARRQDD